MKKIVLASDSLHFSQPAMEFAAWLNEKEPVLLTCAFLPRIRLPETWVIPESGAIPSYLQEANDLETEQLEKNIALFEEACSSNGIEFRVHDEYYSLTGKALRDESRFADLLLLDSGTFYTSEPEHVSDYLQDALKQAECPVVTLPGRFTQPDNIILAYDGSAASVFAIKQFAYLFPELAKLETMLVYAHSGESDDLPDADLVKELVARHFPDLTLYRLETDPKKYFTTWLADRAAAWLVAGAYGRSGLSQLFRKSFITDVIRNHQCPVFIAHQ
jgi:hypothetical protein